MNRDEELERIIVHAIQTLLSEEEYRMSYTKAQELYNKIREML